MKFTVRDGRLYDEAGNEVADISNLILVEMRHDQWFNRVVLPERDSKLAHFEVFPLLDDFARSWGVSTFTIGDNQRRYSDEDEIQNKTAEAIFLEFFSKDELALMKQHYHQGLRGGTFKNILQRGLPEGCMLDIHDNDIICAIQKTADGTIILTSTIRNITQLTPQTEGDPIAENLNGSITDTYELTPQGFRLVSFEIEASDVEDEERLKALCLKESKPFAEYVKSLEDFIADKSHLIPPHIQKSVREVIKATEVVLRKEQKPVTCIKVLSDTHDLLKGYPEVEVPKCIAYIQSAKTLMGGPRSGCRKFLGGAMIVLGGVLLLGVIVAAVVASHGVLLPGFLAAMTASTTSISTAASAGALVSGIGFLIHGKKNLADRTMDLGKTVKKTAEKAAGRNIPRAA